MHRDLVLLPGDGIGPEVVQAAALVLSSVSKKFGHTIGTRPFPIGGAALRAGLTVLPDDTLSACQSADAVLLGAVGDPAFDHLPRAEKIETGLLKLRKSLGVYANLRPARAWEGLEDATPFKPERYHGTDVLIVRELLGGLYFGEPRGFSEDGTSAFNTMRYSEAEVERVARVAFDLARTRTGKLTSVDKANVLESSQLWRRVVTGMAAAYGDVTLEHQYVDAFAMNLALTPSRFDVVLTENLFGDILSDEAGAVCGSLGLLPSASLGDGPGLYEPVHGSAPTLAGKDLANPVGAIGSLALCFRHSWQAEDEARAIEAAIAKALVEGYRTADLTPAGATPTPCSSFARAVAERV
jgi:3-isopropylmalate dehydrogenase